MDRRPKRQCVSRTGSLPSAAHYVGYVEDQETPEMIMRKFEELEKVMAAANLQKRSKPGTSSSHAAASRAESDNGSTHATGSALQHAVSSLEQLPTDQAIDTALHATQPPGTSTAPSQPAGGSPAAADTSDEPLDEKLLLQVFKQTSIFNVRAALANNSVLHAAKGSTRDDPRAANGHVHQLFEDETDALSGDEDAVSDGEGDLEYLRGVWSDEDVFEPGKPKGKASKKQAGRGRRAGSVPPRDKEPSMWKVLGIAARERNIRNQVVMQYNRDTHALVRRRVRMQTGKDDIIQVRVPGPPLPTAWGRTVKPYDPSAPPIRLTVPCAPLLLLPPPATAATAAGDLTSPGTRLHQLNNYLVLLGLSAATNPPPPPAQPALIAPCSHDNTNNNTRQQHQTLVLEQDAPVPGAISSSLISELLLPSAEQLEVTGQQQQQQHTSFPDEFCPATEQRLPSGWEQGSHGHQGLTAPGMHATRSTQPQRMQGWAQGSSTGQLMPMVIAPPPPPHGSASIAPLPPLPPPLIRPPLAPQSIATQRDTPHVPWVLAPPPPPHKPALHTVPPSPVPPAKATAPAPDLPLLPCQPANPCHGSGPATEASEQQDCVTYFEVPDLATCDIRRQLGQNRTFTVVLIHSGWEVADAEDDDTKLVSRLRKLPVPSLCPGGFIFIWSHKTHIQATCKQLYAWGYTYVENLSWVWMHAGNTVLRLLGPYCCRSHLTLIIFRKEGEGRDIQLRHQRSPDVIFDCLRDAQATCAPPSELYTIIETMLPEEVAGGRCLELWAPRGVRRRGWAHAVQHTQSGQL